MAEFNYFNYNAVTSLSLSMQKKICFYEVLLLLIGTKHAEQETLQVWTPRKKKQVL